MRLGGMYARMTSWRKGGGVAASKALISSGVSMKAAQAYDAIWRHEYRFIMLYGRRAQRPLR